MIEFPHLETCDPRQCIASRILKCNRIIATIFRKHLSPFDITNSQLGILFILAKGGERTQQELANKLYLEKSTVSRNLKRLIQNDWIQKKEAKLIFITQDGKVFLESVVPAWKQAMEEARERLTEAGDEALNFLLNQLTD